MEDVKGDLEALDAFFDDICEIESAPSTSTKTRVTREENTELESIYSFNHKGIDGSTGTRAHLHQQLSFGLFSGVETDKDSDNIKDGIRGSDGKC